MGKQPQRKEIIATLTKKYPKFSKVTASMVAHPERYGFITVPLIIIVGHQQHFREKIAPERDAVRFVAVRDKRHQAGRLHFAAVR